MFEGIELIICDLQDLGARCYTYLATLKNMLVACAERNLPVIVADRPIPLPSTVDGPMLQPELESFVAPHNLPLCTGMTPGETAQWLQHDMQLDLDLQIAPMQGWERDGRRGADWPDFIPPSPGIRTWESGQTYLVTVFTEALPDIDVGRGTGMAFRLIGAPWLQSSVFCQQMGNFQLPGIAFYPYRYIAGTPPHAGQELDGIRLSVTDTGKFMPVTCAVHILDVLQQLRGKEKLWGAQGSRPEWFDKLYGTTTTRESLQLSASPQEITAAWSMEQQEFNHSRQRFLLY
jgi:beta-N-acetylhexosaminidase